MNKTSENLRATEVLSVRLTPAQMIKLVDAASESDRSLAYIIRRLVDSLPTIN